MEALPRHTLRPLQHRLPMDQLGPIPVRLHNPPAPFNRIVLAGVGRVIQPLDGLPDVVGALDHSLQKLRPPPTTFWTVLPCALSARRGRLLLVIQRRPPGFACIDDEVTGFLGAATQDAQDMVKNNFPDCLSHSILATK